MEWCGVHGVVYTEWCTWSGVVYMYWCTWGGVHRVVYMECVLSVDKGEEPGSSVLAAEATRPGPTGRGGGTET